MWACFAIPHAVMIERIGERHASACRYKNEVPEGSRHSARRTHFWSNWGHSIIARNGVEKSSFLMPTMRRMSLVKAGARQRASNSDGFRQSAVSPVGCVCPPLVVSPRWFDIRYIGEVPFVIDSLCATRLADDRCRKQFYCNRLTMNVNSFACSDLSAQY